MYIFSFIYVRALYLLHQKECIRAVGLESHGKGAFFFMQPSVQRSVLFSNLEYSDQLRERFRALFSFCQYKNDGLLYLSRVADETPGDPLNLVLSISHRHLFAEQVFPSTEDSSAKKRTVALFSDEPGLGKTITILAFLVSTFFEYQVHKGERRARLTLNQQIPYERDIYEAMDALVQIMVDQGAQEKRKETDEDLFELFWKGLPEAERRRELMKVVVSAREAAKAEALESMCSPRALNKLILHFQQLLQKADHGLLTTGHSSFSSIVDEFARMTQKAEKAEADDSYGSSAAAYSRMLEALKRYMKKAIERSTTRPTASRRFSRAFGAHAESETQRDRKVRTTASLIVVPKTLFGHWKEQIKAHLNLSYTECHVLFIEGLHQQKQRRRGRDEDQGYTEHSAAAVAEDFKQSLLVLVSKEMLSTFWVHMELHKYQAQNKFSAATIGLVDMTRVSKHNRITFTVPSVSVSKVLKKQHWRRIMLDEGHFLSTASYTGYDAFLSCLGADLFWIISGTPGKQTASMNDLKGVERILSIGAATGSHDILSRSAGNRRSMVFSLENVFWKLMNSLRLVSHLANAMIRQDKRSVLGLPGLRTSTVKLSPSADETKTYNAIVSFAKMNILLTSAYDKSVAKSAEAGSKESLLDPKNYRHARQVLRNIRLSCCGGGQMTAQVSTKNLEEFRELLRNRHQVCEEAFQRAMRFVHRTLKGEETVCCNYLNAMNEKLEPTRSSHLCKCRKVMLPIITPCVHFVCIDCFEELCLKPNQFICPDRSCRQPFRISQLSYLQPGFQLQWTELSKPKLGASTIVEEQTVTHNSKAKFIIDHLNAVYARLRYTPKCIVFSQFKNILTVLANELIAAFGEDSVAVYLGSLKDKESELVKFKNGVKESWECSACQFQNRGYARSCQRPMLRLVARLSDREQEITRNFKIPVDAVDEEYHRITLVKGMEISVAGCKLPQRVRQVLDRGYHLENVLFEKHCSCRKKVTDVIKESVDCNILLLSTDGATGLDLSIASEVIFLDKVWDAAMENQVISRAWRMGGTLHGGGNFVNASQLYLEGTVEELMFDLENLKSSENSVVTSSKSKAVSKESASFAERNNEEKKRLTYLFKSLRLLDDPEGRSRNQETRQELQKSKRVAWGSTVS